MKKIIAIVFASLIIFGCTDRNVKKVESRLYEVDGVYLKKVVIDGCSIFFVTDARGNPIAGTSVKEKRGQYTYKSATIVGTP